MNPLFIAAAAKKVVGALLGKKRLIAWGSAVALALGAAATGMQTAEFKEAVCSATILEPAK